MNAVLLGALAAVVLLGVRELADRLANWMGRYMAGFIAAMAAVNAAEAQKRAANLQQRYGRRQGGAA